MAIDLGLEEIVGGGNAKYIYVVDRLAPDPFLVNSFEILVRYALNSYSGQNPLARVTIPPTLNSILTMPPEDIAHGLTSGYLASAMQSAANAFEIESLNGER